MKLLEEVNNLIQNWTPKEKYRSEKRYLSDLREFLYHGLNDYKTGFPKKTVEIKVQQKKESCDLLINNLVGVELKKTTNDKIPKNKIDRIFEELLLNRNVHKEGVIFILVGKSNKETKEYLKKRINTLVELTQVHSVLKIFRKENYKAIFIDKSY